MKHNTKEGMRLAGELEPPDFVKPRNRSEEQSIATRVEVERLHIHQMLEKADWNMEVKFRGPRKASICSGTVRVSSPTTLKKGCSATEIL
jgi:hypothetical protein